MDRVVSINIAEAAFDTAGKRETVVDTRRFSFWVTIYLVTKLADRRGWGEDGEFISGGGTGGVTNEIGFNEQI